MPNLAWGARIRRRYAIAVQLGLVVWCTVGAVVGVVTQVSLTDLLLQWFVPSLGLLLLGIDTYRSQLDTVTARERVQQSVSERIKEYANRGAQESETPGLLVLARQVQDVLLQTRLTQARVPDWFFNRFHATDRADFAVSMGELSRIAAPFTPRLQE
ncbi:S-4TM family putative pore-forming effector [Streptomyces sp. MNU89]|uniref:S-4TM family putative pore-forming effector n=1 Tax=Streptomyces sp. MNU89 TaxID=2560025 RepID=UPI001E373B0B|nr:S-4TM family putative pore-forming effector [Streptomyces sp. MNU89]MCC9741311.1 S-4TM family putative pore-forming effector [Streptomyces sp. MNU89]